MNGIGRPSVLHQRMAALVAFVRAEAAAGRQAPGNAALARVLGLRGLTGAKEVLAEAEARGLLVVERGPAWRIMSAPDGAWRTAPPAPRPQPQGGRPSSFDAGEDAALRAAWAEGLTLGAIAARLGRSRNSVAGRVRRLGLPPRSSPIGQRAPECGKKPARVTVRDLQRAARIAARRAAAPIRSDGVRPVTHAGAKGLARAQASSIPAAPRAPVGDPAPVRSTGGLLDVSSLDLPRPVAPAGGFSGPGCCRWPMWGNRERPSHVYCGAPVSHRRDGTPRPYCEAHAARAFTDKMEGEPGHVITRGTFAWGGVRA